MVVKQKAGRTRYVAFRVEAARPPSRGDMVGAIRGVAADRGGRAAPDKHRLWLTAFDGEHGALRVAHTSVEEAIAVLRAIRYVGGKDNPARVTPLTTSGTLRQARRRAMPADAPAARPSRPKGKPARKPAPGNAARNEAAPPS